MADEGKPSIPSELSLSLDATRTQVTRLLDGLEARGLVQRQLSAHDRRSLELTLTPAGRDLLARAQPAAHAAYSEVWGCLGDDGLATATRTLAQLHNALTASQP